MPRQAPPGPAKPRKAPPAGCTPQNVSHYRRETNDSGQLFSPGALRRPASAALRPPALMICYVIMIPTKARGLRFAFALAKKEGTRRRPPRSAQPYPARCRGHGMQTRYIHVAEQSASLLQIFSRALPAVPDQRTKKNCALFRAGTPPPLGSARAVHPTPATAAYLQGAAAG